MFTSISTLSLNGDNNTHGGILKFPVYLSNHSSVCHEFWIFGVFNTWPNNCLDSTCIRDCVKCTPTSTHTPCPPVYLHVWPPACHFPQSIVSLNQTWRASNCATDNDKRYDGQCTYSVNIEVRSCKPLLQWKISKCCILWVCVYSLRYPACSAHSPYCHLWPALKYFSTLSHKRNDFRKKNLLMTEYALIFSTTIVWNISQYKKNWARYCHKCIRSSYKALAIFVSF
jgi:hypothetical protein